MTTIQDRVLLVGGGLANCMIALRLAEARRDAEVVIVESAEAVCGNHTWSFHETDLEAEARSWIEPLVAYRWEGQCVAFPGYLRNLSTGYASVTSEKLRDAVERHPAISVKTGCAVTVITPGGVDLADGSRLEGGCVIDGRGKADSTSLILGYQKFVGLEIEFPEPHNVKLPVIMDARIPQLDGFRFIYVLPFTSTSLLVEDTRYSGTPDLEDHALEQLILDYVTSQGWGIGGIVRRERGVLPIILAGDAEAYWAEPPLGVARSGLRAGLCHPTTGYSLPLAVRLALLISKLPRLDNTSVRRCTSDLARSQWRQQRLFRYLNRLMFVAAKAHERRALLERFYTLPQGLIERFYSGSLMRSDVVRILVGRPPIPISRSLGVLAETAFIRRTKAW